MDEEEEREWVMGREAPLFVDAKETGSRSTGGLRDVISFWSVAEWGIRE